MQFVGFCAARSAALSTYDPDDPALGPGPLIFNALCLYSGMFCEPSRSTQWTLYDRSITALWLLWLLYDHSMTVLWTLYDHSMTALWPLYDHSMTVLWPFYDRSMIVVLVLQFIYFVSYSCSAGSFSKFYNRSLTALWLLYDRSMTALWPFYDRSMIVV